MDSRGHVAGRVGIITLHCYVECPHINAPHSCFPHVCLTLARSRAPNPSSFARRLHTLQQPHPNPASGRREYNEDSPSRSLANSAPQLHKSPIRNHGFRLWARWRFVTPPAADLRIPDKTDNAPSPTGVSRCFPFWQEVLACYAINGDNDNRAGAKKCSPALEDYMEYVSLALARVPTQHRITSHPFPRKRHNWLTHSRENVQMPPPRQRSGQDPHAAGRVPQAGGRDAARCGAERGRD